MSEGDRLRLVYVDSQAVVSSEEHLSVRDASDQERRCVTQVWYCAAAVAED